jgi:hypothetical protein
VPSVFQYAHLIHAPEFVALAADFTQQLLFDHAGMLLGGDGARIEIESIQRDTVELKLVKADRQGQRAGPLVEEVGRFGAGYQAVRSP